MDCTVVCTAQEDTVRVDVAVRLLRCKSGLFKDLGEASSAGNTCFVSISYDRLGVSEVLTGRF